MTMPLTQETFGEEKKSDVDRIRQKRDDFDDFDDERPHADLVNEHYLTSLFNISFLTSTISMASTLAYCKQKTYGASYMI